MTFEEINKTLTDEEAKKEVSRCLKCPRPLCKMKGCPAELRINEFMKAFFDGNEEEAYRIIRTGSNLPLICSRVCDHDSQCRGACVLNFKHMPIIPGNIERYLADKFEGQNEPFQPFDRDLSVAIIGSGPAGLSCALELAQNGIQSTIFEKEKYFGGILSYGIPEYRLPLSVLNRQIDVLKQAGIKFVNSWNEDISDFAKFDYVVYATGLTKYSYMGIEGENLEGVYDGGTFLKAINYHIRYNEPFNLNLGNKIVVVGAGNVAMDCARSARRLGKEVIVVYRRSEKEAPAAKEELEAAKNEGIEFYFLTNPTKIVGKDHVEKIIVEKMTLGEKDASGRQRPVPTGVYQEFEADNFILAIGQKPDLELAQKMMLPSEKGWISFDEINFVEDKVLAAGDIVYGAKTVVAAMVSGKKAAHAILDKSN